MKCAKLQWASAAYGRWYKEPTMYVERKSMDGMSGNITQEVCMNAYLKSSLSAWKISNHTSFHKKLKSFLMTSHPTHCIMKKLPFNHCLHGIAKIKNESIPVWKEFLSGVALDWLGCWSTKSGWFAPNLTLAWSSLQISFKVKSFNETYHFYLKSCQVPVYVGFMMLLFFFSFLWGLDWNEEEYMSTCSLIKKCCFWPK